MHNMPPELFELLVQDSVPTISRSLGLPRDLVERAVRHTFQCTEEPCDVDTWLTNSMVDYVARAHGLPFDRIWDIADSTTKAATDTLAHLSQLNGGVTPTQVREAFLNGGRAGSEQIHLIQKGTRNDPTE